LSPFFHIDEGENTKSGLTHQTFSNHRGSVTYKRLQRRRLRLKKRRKNMSLSTTPHSKRLRAGPKITGAHHQEEKGGSADARGKRGGLSRVPMNTKRDLPPRKRKGQSQTPSPAELGWRGVGLIPNEKKTTVHEVVYRSFRKKRLGDFQKIAKVIEQGGVRERNPWEKVLTSVG